MAHRTEAIETKDPLERVAIDKLFTADQLNYSRRVIAAAGERYSLIVRTTLEVGRPLLTGPFSCFRIASS